MADQARAVARGPRGRHPLHDRDAVQAATTGSYVLDAAPQRRAQAGAEAAPAAVGGVLTARHDPARRREGHRRARASPSSTPRRPRSGCTTTRRRSPRRACPVGRRGQPPGRVRDADDVPRRRGRRRCDAASRAPTSSATRSPTTTCSASHVPARPTCGRSSSSAATRWATPPRPRSRRKARRSGPRSRPATTRACAARSARPTRCASSCAATRRPASTRSSSCCRPARNRHEHIMESLEMFGTRDPARVRRA